MTRKLFITALAAAALLWACDVKEPIYNTAHPRRTQVSITTAWPGIDPAIKPARLTAEVDETAYTDIPTTGSYTFPLMDPGTPTIRIHNEAPGITLNRTIAVADYSSPLGWLFTGLLQDNLEADTDYELTVPMKQQVRRLTLIVELTGNHGGDVAGIEASLSGAAGTLDIDSDLHSSPSSVALHFTKITSGANAGKWCAIVRLLGVAGGEQKLTGTILFTGGTPADVTLESDLTEDMAGFNAKKNEPMTLGGSMELNDETETEVGFTAIINEWNPVNSGSGIAD